MANLLEHDQGGDWKVFGLTLVMSTSSNNGVGVRRSVLVGLERTRKIWRKKENFFFFFFFCYPRHHKFIPLNYFYHQNVKPYPMTLPIPLLLNVQNNSPSPFCFIFDWGCFAALCFGMIIICWTVPALALWT